MNHQLSRLQKLRSEYTLTLPKILQNLHNLNFQKKEETSTLNHKEQIQKLFPQTYGRQILEAKEGDPRLSNPLRVGVVFSGGQASGGHNVISGLFDALTALCPQSKLFGFLEGPSGILENRFMELSREVIAPYRNIGGFDLIGSGRTKIEKEEQLVAAMQTVQKNKLDSLVIIGGDDSNTNAAILAEFFLKQQVSTSVIGVPKTIDGDLKNPWIATSFGFDTATKTYSEMIGNIAKDALSAKKYYHFIKLMGRSASHITLECALATHPNLALIAEEIFMQKMTLADLVSKLADLIELRAKNKKEYGVILIPEGLIEFIPEIKMLIAELNQQVGEDLSNIKEKLSPAAYDCFECLPLEIQRQLLLERDPHGNIQLSLIETDKLLIELIKKELSARSFKGKFSPLSHFLGYEGRAGFPSNFDAHYCYALGYATALLAEEKMTGYMACIGNLQGPVSKWSVFGLPITMLMHLEKRMDKEKPVIQKALVDLNSKAFAFFKENRENWLLEDHYRVPGPIQFFGESEIVDSIPLTMQIEAI